MKNYDTVTFFLYISLSSIILIQTTKCPEYFYLNNLTKKCHLNEYIQNNDYHQKYSLFYIEKSFNNLINSSKYPLIGPIPGKNQSDFFFISLFDSFDFSLSDYSYVISKDASKKGYIFRLSHFSSNEERDNSTNDTIIHNIKFFKNIGSKIEAIKIIPQYKKLYKVDQYGIMIKYTEGDICEEDPTQYYQTYLFLYCNNQLYFGFPTYKLQKKCTYIFEYSLRNACPICIRSSTENVSEGCINGIKRVHYIEKENCIITKKERDIINDNIIHGDLVNFHEEEAILIYNQERFSVSDENFEIDIPIMNKTNENDFITNNIEEIKCDIYSEGIKKIKNNFWTVLLVSFVILSYIGLLVFLVALFRKYSQVSKDYSRLKQEGENETHPNNTVFPTNSELVNL